MNLTADITSTFATRVLVAGLGLISSVVLARYLGPDGRGFFALVMLLPELAVTFALLGFDQAYAVYAGLEPTKRLPLLWQAAAVAVLAGSIAGIVGASVILLGSSGVEAMTHGPAWLYVLPLAFLPVRLFHIFGSAILRGMKRIALVNAYDLGSKIVAVTLIFIVVAWLGLGVEGAVFTEAALALGGIVLLLYLFRIVGVWGMPQFDRPLWRRTTRFALPAYVGSVTSWLNYRVDQLIIAVMLPPAQLAFYILAVDLAERLWILAGAVSSAVLPHLTTTDDRDPALAAAVARHVMVWTGLACLILFLFAQLLVVTLYSTEFAEAVAPLRWLLPGVFALSIGKVLVQEVVAREKVHITMWIALVAALVNVVGNLALIPRMGIAGAALASSLSYCLVAGLVTWTYVRVTGVTAAMLIPRRSDLIAYSAVWPRLQEAFGFKLK